MFDEKRGTPRRFQDLPMLKWAVLFCALFWAVLWMALVRFVL